MGRPRSPSSRPGRRAKPALLFCRALLTLCQEVLNKQRGSSTGAEKAPPARRDAHALLGLEKGASKAEIKAAYRQKARELHPDVSPAADAGARFAEVAAAYAQLTEGGPGEAEPGAAMGSEWPEFKRAPKKASSKSSARSASYEPAADAADETGTAAEAGPRVGDVVEYPLPPVARLPGEERTHGVGLLVSRNLDRGDAASLPPALLDLCEIEPLTQRELGGFAWVPDDLAAPVFPRIGELRVVDRRGVTYRPQHDSWTFTVALSPGCAGPAHEEEIMV